MTQNHQASRGEYFKTDTQFWNWMRSQLRQVWSKHPTKLDFLKSKRYTKRVGNRPIYHIDCTVCGEPNMLKNIEVNHKKQCGNVKEAGYHLRLLDVGYADMECVCKPCHAIITYSERQGISFEEAKIEKQVIAFGKLPAAKQKEILGSPSATTIAGRKDEYRERLLSNNQG